MFDKTPLDKVYDDEWEDQLRLLGAKKFKELAK